MMKKLLPLVAVLVALVWSLHALAVAAEDKPAYKVLEKVKVGGEGGWDYLAVDEAGQRLFVPRSTHVMVLDLNSDKLAPVGDITDTPGVHGVALAPKSGRGFTSNGRDNSVTIFDLKSLKTLGKVKTGTGPDAIVFDPASGNVLAINHRSGTVTAFSADIDPAKPAQTTEIEVGGTLEYGVVDEAGHLYVNVEDKNLTVAIDTKTLKVTDRWALGEGEEPTGLAIDAKKGLLFATCHNEKLIVLDSHTGKIVATLPIGKNVDGAAFDPARGLAFSSNGDGTLTLVSDRDAAHPAVVGTVNTMKGARTIGIDTATHRLYLPTAEYAPAPSGGAGGAGNRPAAIPGSFTIVIVG
jgi:DNA-binding beta-propeller fold protein YncE